MSQQDFFAWTESREGRYEFDGFQPVAMAPCTNNHGTVSRNLNGQLYVRLRGLNCRSMPPDGGGVATIGNRVRSPEATVTCTEIPGRDRLVPDPVIVFEVISESTRRIDQVDKLSEYHAVPSIKRYVVIEQGRVAVTVHARKSDELWAIIVLGMGETLDLPEIGVGIPLADLYEDVVLDEASV